MEVSPAVSGGQSTLDTTTTPDLHTPTCTPNACRALSAEIQTSAASSYCFTSELGDAGESKDVKNKCYLKLRHDITDCDGKTTGQTCTVSCKPGYTFNLWYNRT